MNVYSSEDEQVEALKKWWKENGRAVIIGLVLGVGVVISWRSWVNYQEKHAQKASVAYEELLIAQNTSTSQESLDKHQESLDKQMELLLEEYGDTAYASAARLSMAKVFMEQNKPEQAEGLLRLVMTLEKAEGNQSGMATLSQLRLTRLLLDQSKYDAAWQLASRVPNDSRFKATFEELKGDILVAQKKTEPARSAYKSALLAGAKNADYLQMKLDDLGTPDQPEPSI